MNSVLIIEFDHVLRQLLCILYTSHVRYTPMYISLLEKDYIALNIQLRENYSDALVKNNSCTLLHLAAGRGDTKAIEILLAYGFDPNASYVERVKTKNNSFVDELEVTVTPLFLAVLSGSEDAIRMLRQAGASMENLKSNNHWASLLTFTIFMDKTELFEELLDYADSLDQCDSCGISYLVMSIVLENNRTLQVLVDRGADVNDQNNTKGCTPLHFAVGCNNVHALRILCEANCRLDLKNNEGLTALCFADMTRRWHMMKELLLYESNPDAHKDCIINGFENDTFQLNMTNEEEDALHWLLIFIGAKWQNHFFLLFVKLRSPEIIMKFHIKTQIAGIHFQSEFKIPEGTCSPEENFKNRCLDEIKMMKKHRLFGDISMYSFLRASKRSLVVLANKEQVKDVFSSNMYNKEYPLYKSFLEYNFRIGQIYQPVYDRAYDSLNAATEFIFPDLVIHQILEFIDRQSMNCLIEAAELISKINIGNLHF